MNTVKDVSIEKKRLSMLLFEQASALVQMVMRDYGVDERRAIADFYHSETYRLLADDGTKLWWLSVYAIFEVYKTELETGSAMNSSYILPRYA